MNEKEDKKDEDVNLGKSIESEESSPLRMVTGIVLLLLLLAALTFWGVFGPDPKEESKKTAQASQGVLNITISEVRPVLKLDDTALGDTSLNEPSSGIDYSNMRCTKSIPAICNAEIRCITKAEMESKACVYLKENSGEMFKELDSDLACAQIYGGPERAEIKGRWGKRKVDITLNRSNGCEMERWDLHSPLWQS